MIVSTGPDRDSMLRKAATEEDELREFEAIEAVLTRTARREPSHPPVTPPRRVTTSSPRHQSSPMYRSELPRVGSHSPASSRDVGTGGETELGWHRASNEHVPREAVGNGRPARSV